MKTAQLCVFLCCVFLMTPLTFGDGAEENSTSIQEEIREIKRLVREVAVLLSALEKRLEVLEKKATVRLPANFLMFPLEGERGMMFDAYDPVKTQRPFRRLIDEGSIKPIDPGR